MGNEVLQVLKDAPDKTVSKADVDLKDYQENTVIPPKVSKEFKEM